MPELKLLLIDGNNTCHKIFWAMKKSKQALCHKGKHTEVIYGFFRKLVSLHKDYPDYFRVIAWDRGATRRREEAAKAVEAGIIPDGYKANRHLDDNEEEQESIHSQMDELNIGLKLVNCLQVAIDGVEADDIINSYVLTYRKWNAKFVIVSSDKDFYSLLDDNVSILRGDEMMTREQFSVESGIQPEQWLEVGALTGEKGDNIYGVDGWGPVTACKYVKEYGGIDAIIAAVQTKEKKSKKEEMLLASIPRLLLAHSLKSMDVVPNLPKPRIQQPFDAKALEQYFLEWSFASLLKEIPRLA
jgi:DNA polymerase-1